MREVLFDKPLASVTVKLTDADLFNPAPYPLAVNAGGFLAELEDVVPSDQLQDHWLDVIKPSPATEVLVTVTLEVSVPEL